MKSPNQNEAEGKTPEELARFLDSQIASLRAHRKEESPQKRAAILMTVFILIIAGAGFALLILAQMLPDTRHAPKKVHLEKSGPQR